MLSLCFNRCYQHGTTARDFISQRLCDRLTRRCKAVCLLMVTLFTLLAMLHSFDRYDIPTKMLEPFLYAAEDTSMDEMFKHSKQVSNHLFMYKGQLVIPPRGKLETLSRLEIEDLYHRYVENIQYNCKNQIHYGKESDGGYYYCEDVPLAKPCMMYSFGTRNDYGFDDRIAHDVGCEVHSFDPGDGQESHQRSDQVWFHAIGLGGSSRIMQSPPNQGNKKWVIYDLTDTRSHLAHQEKPLDILKIDTEGMIWETLADIARPGVIDDVKLLIMELHVNYPLVFSHDSHRSVADYVQHLDGLRRLYDLGFRMYYFQRWDMCIINDDAGRVRTGCHDVHLIQTKYIDIDAATSIKFNKATQNRHI